MLTTIYFDHIIILVGLYQAHLSCFQQLNQPIRICLFGTTTKLMLMNAFSLSVSLIALLLNYSIYAQGV